MSAAVRVPVSVSVPVSRAGSPKSDAGPPSSSQCPNPSSFPSRCTSSCPPASRSSSSSPSSPPPAWHQRFLAMLPTIEEQARYAFRDVADDGCREEAVQEIIANALVAFVRLVDQGREEVAYASSLSRYAILQYRQGRRVAVPVSSDDLHSEYARRKRKLRVKPIQRYVSQEGSWKELIIEDRHASPAEVAALRIDFREWMRRLPLQKRRIAARLAIGETTRRVAEMFHLSWGRISQIRRELMESWQTFQGEPVGA